MQEVPTLLMALGKLGLWRSDPLFGASYFLLRLVFQSYSVYMATQSDLDVYRRYTMPMLGALLIHVYWFYAWVGGMRKRMLKKKAQEEEKKKS